nr:immunoglobulin heavy chain junction region [Macaca mulatta]MPN69649.1 immunoglobulin heavy chain junction region [Macaca mulatta]MPN69694.1 immunoglobulin heavy chain junction region [Macaca mulatta]MPN69989.1 immunoglobulin heavy chain junction region [Macaca mulatta]MPN70667.1 immunoglobulin heavy chain junction region [Macaca mulatta]
CTTVNFPYYW